MRQARRVLGEPCELRVRTGVGKDAGITLGESAPTLSLQCAGDDDRAAARDTGVDDLVNEIDEIVWKANRNLLAHPKTVAKR